MATPVVPAPAAVVVRDGDKLIVPRLSIVDGATLPPVCVKCGQPSGPPLKRSFYWHEPWLYLLILAGVLIYAILALVLRKRMILMVPLCDAHRTRRRNLLLAAWLIGAAGIAVPFLFNAIGLDVGIGVLLMILMIVAGAVIGALTASPIRPKRIDDTCGIFTGCAEVFLQQFPPAGSLAARPAPPRPVGTGVPPPPPPPR